MSFFDKFISGVCVLHPVFLHDILSDVIRMTSNYSGDSALSSAKAILPRSLSFLRQKIGGIF